MQWDEVKSFALRYHHHLASHFPDYVLEMEGVAKGAGVSYADILALNVRTEIAFGAFSDGCTALSVHGEGKGLLAQNWDWNTECVALGSRGHGKRGDGLMVLQTGRESDMLEDQERRWARHPDDHRSRHHRQDRAELARGGLHAERDQSTRCLVREAALPSGAADGDGERVARGSRCCAGESRRGERVPHPSCRRRRGHGVGVLERGRGALGDG